MVIKKKDLLWSYAGTVLALGINFIIIPILMRYLDQNALGLWQVFSSIGSIAILLDFGFSPTLARSIAYIWSGASDLKKTGGYVVASSKEPNYDMLSKVLKVCQRIYLVISLFALLLLSTIGTVYILHITKDFTSHRHLIAWTIYLLAVFINLYFYYCSAALIGIGQVGNNNKAKFYASIVQIVACFILCVLQFGIIAPCFAYLLFGLFFRGLARRCFYSTNNLKEKLHQLVHQVEASEIKRIFLVIWHNAWRDGLVVFSMFLIGQANTIICSLFYSLQQTAMYSLSLQFVQGIGIVSGVAYATFQPKMQAAFIRQDITETKRLVSFSVVTYCITFFVSFITLIAIGIPFLELVNRRYVFDIPLLLGIGLYIFLQKRFIMYCSFISNTNKVPYVKPFILSGFFSVLLSIVFSKCLSIGIWGLVLGQFLSQSVYNNWHWSRRVKKTLDLDAGGMFKSAVNDYKRIFREIIAKRKQ